MLELWKFGATQKGANVFLFHAKQRLNGADTLCLHPDVTFIVCCSREAVP